MINADAIVWHYGYAPGFDVMGDDIVSWPTAWGEQPDQSGLQAIYDAYNAYQSDQGFKNQLIAYRDAYIEQEISVGLFTILNTKEKRSELSSLKSGWIDEGGKETVIFKNADKSRAPAAIRDIQNMSKACFLREQKGRAAEDVVLTNHAANPYTDDSWKTDFNAEVA